MLKELLVRMFDEMVVQKNSALISTFYDPEFVMISNGVTQGFEAFRASHASVYETSISYLVEFDDDSWVEQTDRVAARLWITTARPGEAATRIEVIVIAVFRSKRILKLWELTLPNWTNLAAFEHYSD